MKASPTQRLKSLRETAMPGVPVSLVDSLVAQRDTATHQGESDIAAELQEQIDALHAPPEAGHKYLARLESSHHRSFSGTYLDAHRPAGVKRDKRSGECTFALVHAQPVDGQVDVGADSRRDVAGQWLFETLDGSDDEFLRLPRSMRHKAFRLRLTTSHYG